MKSYRRMLKKMPDRMKRSDLYGQFMFLPHPRVIAGPPVFQDATVLCGQMNYISLANLRQGDL
jgi:hypothetical protein